MGLRRVKALLIVSIRPYLTTRMSETHSLYQTIPLSGVYYFLFFIYPDLKCNKHLF
jgi:hypothetical protein